MAMYLWYSSLLEAKNRIDIENRKVAVFVRYHVVHSQYFRRYNMLYFGGGGRGGGGAIVENKINKGKILTRTCTTTICCWICVHVCALMTVSKMKK